MPTKPTSAATRYPARVESSKYTSPSSDSSSTRSTRRRSVNATSTKGGRVHRRLEHRFSRRCAACPRRIWNRAAGRSDEALVLRESIHEFFSQRAASSRRKLRDLFHRGRISLIIALAFLAASIAIGDALASYLGQSRTLEILREGLLIVGWVAMWRPLELFLYDWWPVRAEARLFDRLSIMPVRISTRRAMPPRRGARTGRRRRPPINDRSDRPR